MRIATAALTIAALAMASSALAAPTVVDYEDLTEGFYGRDWTHQGIRYYDLNIVGGVFPDGSTFDPELNDEMVIEDASLLYLDFPDWGSEQNLLTFGTAYINGDNLSLGRLSTVMMDLPEVADAVSVDVGFYENGPWGGIVVHLDAYRSGELVGSDSFTIADGGGRDNVAVTTMAISGAEFDQLHMYATYGDDYSLPRIILDDLTINYVAGGPTLTVSGDCPGTAELSVAGATPGGIVGFVFAAGQGSVMIPSGPCAGTQLGLNATARLVGTDRADANGSASMIGRAPARACGGFLQAVDVSTCTTTNVAGF